MNPKNKLPKNSFIELPQSSSINEYNKLSTIMVEKEFIALLKDCAAEKRASQKELYYVFYDFTISICLRYTNTKDEALEVMNDGFLKVFKNIKQFNLPVVNAIPAFKSWLKKIMIFTAIDAYRKNKQHALSVDIEQADELENYDTGLLENISYKEIIETIMQLTPVYRAVFCMYVIDGFKHEEIAQQLGIVVGTSKSNLAKARLQLQKKLIDKQKFTNYEQRAV